MKKKIIIAGAGHGGIATGAILARNGFDVCVYEKRKRSELGYDWPDTFELSSVEEAGLPLPDSTKLEKSTNITFVPPSENSIIVQDISSENLTVKMERRDIYDLLIKNAEDAGVNFIYGCEIEAPLLAGDRVIGIKTADGNIYGDLVIDACGIDSPLRAQLPDCSGIEKHTKKNERFYVYRALCEKKKEALHKYKVYLIPNGRMGIGWVICEKDYCDLLIGEFEPFTLEEAEERTLFFREHNEALGEKVLRGGVLAEIPVRQPISVMVCDGYALIGDSAFMTVPLLGSGISNSFRASSILADVIINDETQTYSAETLWDYQKRYYDKVGTAMAKMAMVRCMLPELKPEQIDEAFDNGIITRDDLTISTGSIINTDATLIKKAVALIKDRELATLLADVGINVGRISSVCSKLPEYYSRKEVLDWAEKYDSIFTDFINKERG
ncbi:MAG: NAD(P)/FAD-dependent oxidoreductase [Eubacterium sp.]|nr:NAD(P)/FAD-dependent oxidoreductase [Eubacterium sp.]